MQTSQKRKTVGWVESSVANCDGVDRHFDDTGCEPNQEVLPTVVQTWTERPLYAKDLVWRKLH